MSDDVREKLTKGDVVIHLFAEGFPVFEPPFPSIRGSFRGLYSPPFFLCRRVFHVLSTVHI